jgi:hypothetical protein
MRKSRFTESQIVRIIDANGYIERFNWQLIPTLTVSFHSIAFHYSSHFCRIKPSPYIENSSQFQHIVVVKNRWHYNCYR